MTTFEDRVFLKIFLILFIYFILGVHCCSGFSLVVMHGFLVAEAFVAEHGLWRARASVAAARGFSSWASWTLEQLRPMALVAPQRVGSSQIRIKTKIPALADGFLTTEPPGKPETGS